MSCEYADTMSHGPNEMKKAGQTLGYDRCASINFRHKEIVGANKLPDTMLRVQEPRHMQLEGRVLTVTKNISIMLKRRQLVKPL